MKLYHLPQSPNSYKVRAVAFHLGIDLEEHVVNLFEGEQKNPDFLALNPNGMVPTLVDGDFVLWESNAIMQYLAATAPPNILWPDSAAQRACITRWQCWQLAHWGPAANTIIGERVIKKLAGGGEPDQAVIDAAEEKLHRFAAVLDGQLEGRDFLHGAEPTIADLSVAAPLIYTEQAQLPLGDYPSIQRWYANVAALEGWKRATP